MNKTAPFWSAAQLISESVEPADFQVSLEDIVSETGRLTSGELSLYSAKGTPFTHGDVLFGKLRPYLAKYWLADRDGTAGGDIHVYRPSDATEPRFLKYVVSSENFIKFAEASSKGTKMPRTEWTSIREFRIRRHDLETQRRIADYLDRETGEIDAMIGKLGELEAELVERKREVAANALLPYGVPGDPTSLDGFEELGYTNIASIGVLVDRRQERNTDQHAQYLSLMKGAGVIRYEDKGDVGNKKPEDLTRTIRVKSGDYLVNSMNFYIGSYGRSSYDGVCSSVYLVFSPNEELVIGDFFKYFFANDELRDRIQDLGHGILEHRRGIVWDRFSAVKVPLPPLEEQRRIADHLDEVTSKIDAMLAKVAELKDLLTERRAALITDVVTGRKDVA